ncbi:MAG: hypothetical protein J6O04_08325 [Selenomonadaceae bacterium]|nr:hypothetical protein [Selenomonadaceae bacterium]
MNKTTEKIIGVLRDFNYSVPEDTSVDLLGAGVLDSFDMVNIIAGIEGTFNIEIAPEDITPTNFDSIDHMSNLLIRKYGADK